MRYGTSFLIHFVVHPVLLYYLDLFFLVPQFITPALTCLLAGCSSAVGNKTHLHCMQLSLLYVYNTPLLTATRRLSKIEYIVHGRSKSRLLVSLMDYD